MKYFILFIAAVFLFTAPAAHAAPCSNPSGDEGDQVYNITYHVMQYCNGSHWVAMGSVMGMGDNLGHHTAAQALDMSGHAIQNLAAPASAQDAVNKQYADTELNKKIDKAGGAMTGILSLSGAPTAHEHAATKGYVDLVVAGASGALTIPVDDPDACTLNGPMQWIWDGSEAVLTCSGGASQALKLDWAQISGGYTHTCGLTTNGTAYCWGNGANGQLGNGWTSASLTPLPVSGGYIWAQISAGYAHTCGITTGGTAYCWGQNSNGQLGNGNTTQKIIPEEVSGGHLWAQISAAKGYYTTCGVTTSGEAYCWGDNYYGQLGDGSTTAKNVPTKVSGTHSWTQISTGGLHTCGVTTANEIYCWGYGTSGQLGYGGSSSGSAPGAKVSGSHTWAHVDAGYQHTCGMNTSGAVYCWGSISANSATPVAVGGGHTWAQISAGGQHACGRTTSGAIGCWGNGNYGKLGNGGPGDSSVPILVSGGHSWTQLGTAGYEHTCGVRSDGTSACWGRNAQGQLGNGGKVDSALPVRVVDDLF